MSFFFFREGEFTKSLFIILYHTKCEFINNLNLVRGKRFEIPFVLIYQIKL